MNLGARFIQVLRDNGAHLFGDRWRRRQLRRMASAAPSSSELIAQMRSWIPELPPTIFRCGACNAKVGYYYPDRRKRRWRMPDRCQEHGQLDTSLSFVEWQDEWTRRGKPDRLTVYLKPVQ